MKLTTKAHEQLDALLAAFESGQIAEAIAHTTLEGPPEIPVSGWSFHNQLLVYLSGTLDARGFKQWKDTGRHVKKGSKAVYILVPLKRKKKDEDPDTGQERERQYTYGFKGCPVFKLEDTDGDPLPELEPLEPPEPPPLSDVAEAWNIPIKYIPFARKFYGTYRHGFFGTEEIYLCTHDEEVFFHELAHAAHRRVKGSLQGGQDWKQETVAELSAAVLARLHGKNTEGTAYRYIKAYAEDAGRDAHKACIDVLTETKAVLDLILSTAERLQPELAAAD